MTAPSPDGCLEWRGSECVTSIDPDDEDGDGHSKAVDCDDGDPTIHPYAEEVFCDGIDQDCLRGDCCDNDDDGDGYACREDCDDGDPDAYPGAPVPDGCYSKDTDCDGMLDGLCDTLESGADVRRLDRGERQQRGVQVDVAVADVRRESLEVVALHLHGSPRPTARRRSRPAGTTVVAGGVAPRLADPLDAVRKSSLIPAAAELERLLRRRGETEMTMLRVVERAGVSTLLALSVGLVGCAMEEGGDGAEASIEETTRERLAYGLPLDVVPSETRIEVSTRFGDEEVGERELPVRFGRGRVSTGPEGDLIVESLYVELADFDISPSLAPPNGVHLTDVKVELVSPVEAETTWYGDGIEAFAEVRLDLRVEWSYVASDGRTIRLAPQYVEGVVFGTTLRRSRDGRILVEASAEVPGVVLTWPGFAEISDLRVDLTALEALE